VVRDVGAAYLCSVCGEEVVRFHNICDGTADDRKPVEYDRRFIGIRKQQLAQDIEHNCYNQESSNSSSDHDTSSALRNLLGQRPRKLFEDTHFAPEKYQRR
jgi:hypothetical protein